MGRLAVKICGLTVPEEARAAAAAGARAIGLVFVSGSSRLVDAARAARIVAALPPGVLAVGVFANAEAAAIRETCRLALLPAAQLHGNEPESLAGKLAGLRLIKAGRVASGADVRRLFAWPAAAFLLDSGGGTGQPFPWAAARGAGRERPVILAGGLTPANLARAVAEVQPFAVDVSSAVESAPGRKDLALVREFLAAAAALETAGRRPDQPLF